VTNCVESGNMEGNLKMKVRMDNGSVTGMAIGSNQ
jgi:hypothetical protein